MCFVPLGPLYLYYGCRSPAVDCLYKKEIKAMEGKGILESAKLAFSQDEKSPKVSSLTEFVFHMCFLNLTFCFSVVMRHVA